MTWGELAKKSFLLSATKLEETPRQEEKKFQCIIAKKENQNKFGFFSQRVEFRTKKSARTQHSIVRIWQLCTFKRKLLKASCLLHPRQRCRYSYSSFQKFATLARSPRAPFRIEWTHLEPMGLKFTVCPFAFLCGIVALKATTQVRMGPAPFWRHPWTGKCHHLVGHWRSDQLGYS